MLDAARCPVITVSDRNDKADMVAKNIRLSSDKVDFCVLHNEGLDKVELHIPGEFSVYNAMSVIACAKALGISVAEASNALKNCHGVKGRVEVVPTGLDFTMIIDYAHTPDALENVLNTARGFTKGRLMVLFGCGGDRDNKKRPIMGNIAAQLADFVIVTSDNPRTENPGAIIREILEGMKNTKTPYVVIEDRIEAIGYAMDNAKSGDVVILAGKGHETYQIVGKEKHHMDEREIIAEHLSTMKKCLQ